MVGFQWDEEKSAANEAKHCVTFLQAAHIFRGFILRREDKRRDYGERRFIALGACEGDILKVVYTYRDGDIRIISAWKAGQNDREIYTREQQNREIRKR